MSYSTGMHHAHGPQSIGSNRKGNPNWKRSVSQRFYNECDAVKRELQIASGKGYVKAVDLACDSFQERVYGKDELRFIAEIVVFAWAAGL